MFLSVVLAFRYSFFSSYAVAASSLGFCVGSLYYENVIQSAESVTGRRGAKDPVALMPSDSAVLHLT